jgi:hypothetical protein
MAYYLEDQETGELTEVSKETYDRVQAFRKAMPRNSTAAGIVFVTSTAGELSGSNMDIMRRIFHEPTAYKLIEK